MQVFLHIGYPKTGSSAIQSHISCNRGWLHRQGIYVATTGFTAGAGHSFLLGQFLGDAVDSEAYDQQQVLALQVELAGAATNGYVMVLLSGEGFALASVRALSALAQNLRDFRVRLLVYLREQGELHQTAVLQNMEQLRLGPYSEEIVEVVSEPADSSVWVASRDAVQHIGVTGEILHDVDLGGSREDDDDDSDDESEFDVRALALFIQLNRLPVADTGDDVNALTNVSVQLDGSQSYDPEGRLITFSWLVAAPLGSSAALHDATHPLPRLTPDVAGDYLVELIVNDGESDSAPSQVTVSVSDEVAPPNARAGRDQPVLLGSGVVLDGSTSDDPNDFPLSFAWSLLQVPTGSTLTDADIGLSDTPRPEFVPDVEGTYGLNLRVDNGVLVDDDAVQVLVSGPNVAPIAEAGPRRATQTNQLVSLDGSGSFDPDTGPGVLTHSWSLVARPLLSLIHI